jgi:hypothetical protein
VAHINPFRVIEGSLSDGFHGCAPVVVEMFRPEARAIF